MPRAAINKRTNVKNRVPCCGERQVKHMTNATAGRVDCQEQEMTRQPRQEELRESEKHKLAENKHLPNETCGDTGSQSTSVTRHTKTKNNYGRRQRDATRKCAGAEDKSNTQAHENTIARRVQKLRPNTDLGVGVAVEHKLHVLALAWLQHTANRQHCKHNVNTKGELTDQIKQQPIAS